MLTVNFSDAELRVIALMAGVQWFVPAWLDKQQFVKDYAICEGIYGRQPSDLDVSRAHARYLKKVTQLCSA